MKSTQKKSTNRLRQSTKHAQTRQGRARQAEQNKQSERQRALNERVERVGRLGRTPSDQMQVDDQAHQAEKNMPQSRTPRFTPAEYAARQREFFAQHLLRLLDAVLRFEAPADWLLSRYFREYPQLGGRDRGILAEMTYAVLRQKAWFAHCAESGQGMWLRRMVVQGLAASQDTDVLENDVLKNLCSPEELDWLAHLRTLNVVNTTLPLRTNLPQWLLDKLLVQYGEAETLALATALNQNAPLDLRVNTLKANLAQVQAALQQASIAAEPIAGIANALRVQGKRALQKQPAFEQGWFEVQDVGSQLLAYLVAPKRGDMVVDFCAGAGGKTLALAALMRSTGRLYAFDVSDGRLAALKPRMARSGLSNVQPVRIDHENDTKVKRLAGKIDRVLVDAPCSGLGTLRRNPDLKWRQSEQSVAELVQKQQSILQSASRLVKPGGRLVYATCSILVEENQQIAEWFLAQNPEWKLVSAHSILRGQQITFAEPTAAADPYLVILPHQLSSDGFFAAVFERNEQKEQKEQKEYKAQKATQEQPDQPVEMQTKSKKRRATAEEA